MPDTATAEQKTDQKVEDVLKGSSPEPEGVSPETGEKAEGDETKGEKPEEETTAKAEVKAEAKAKLSPEDKYKADVQAGVDKGLNRYRETRETDTALIRSLSSQVQEFKSKANAKEDNKLIASILSEDEVSGVTPEDTKTRETALKEFNLRYRDYQVNKVEVEEAAQAITAMTEKMPAKVVKEFGLNDPNPTVRAVNGARFLEDTVSVFSYNQDFLMVVEEFLPKGDELRKQLEEIANGLAEFENEKSKRLFIQDKRKGLKVAPRRSPTLPSDGAGGKDWSKATASEKVAEQMRRDRNKK